LTRTDERPTIELVVLGLLVAGGGAHDPPWLVVALVLAILASLLLADLILRRTGRDPWRGHIFSGGPWYWKATFFAVVGCATVYNAVTSGDGRWWLLSLGAWSGFVWMVVGRDRAPG